MCVCKCGSWSTTSTIRRERISCSSESTKNSFKATLSFSVSNAHSRTLSESVCNYIFVFFFPISPKKIVPSLTFEHHCFVSLLFSVSLGSSFSISLIFFVHSFFYILFFLYLSLVRQVHLFLSHLENICHFIYCNELAIFNQLVLTLLQYRRVVLSQYIYAID